MVISVPPVKSNFSLSKRPFCFAISIYSANFVSSAFPPSYKSLLTSSNFGSCCGTSCPSGVNFSLIGLSLKLLFNPLRLDFSCQSDEGQFAASLSLYCNQFVGNNQVTRCA